MIGHVPSEYLQQLCSSTALRSTNKPSPSHELYYNTLNYKNSAALHRKRSCEVLKPHRPQSVIKASLKTQKSIQSFVSQEDLRQMRDKKPSDKIRKSIDKTKQSAKHKEVKVLTKAKLKVAAFSKTLKPIQPKSKKKKNTNTHRHQQKKVSIGKKGNKSMKHSQTCSLIHLKTKSMIRDNDTCNQQQQPSQLVVQPVGLKTSVPIFCRTSKSPLPYFPQIRLVCQ